MVLMLWFICVYKFLHEIKFSWGANWKYVSINLWYVFIIGAFIIQSVICILLQYLYNAIFWIVFELKKLND